MKQKLLCTASLSACLLFGQAAPPPPQVKSQTKPAAKSQPKPTAASATPATPSAPESPDAVVLKVGTETFTRAEMDRLIDSLPERARTEVRTSGKRKLAEQLADLKVASQEARRRKLDQKPAVKQQMAIQADNLLANALFAEVISAAKPGEPELKDYYEKHKSEYQRVKARHILVRFQGSRVPVRPNAKDVTETEALAKAQELHKRLVAGEDFAALAKAESDDTGSGANGGDLGIFPRGQMVPQFDEVVFAAPVGKVNDPVKTQFGYHLIQVQEQLNKSFEEVRPEIEQKIKPELAKKQMEELRKTAAITIDDAYFGKP
ncbi:MAG TPA: peptidylprolyl isomerase [Bryobacteraceae bacterium]|nr:peptidylprolyl isomerase [Bryobacteraceae bacterium]